MYSYSIEPLEDRIAPAVLLNPTTLNYVDQDGDLVTVKFSLPLLSSLTVAKTIFNFNTGTVVQSPATDATPQQLDLIDLSTIVATGTNITVTVKHAGQGDGYAAIGYIKAQSDLGAISIAGDLGGLTAGASTVGIVKPPPGVKSLSVLSMGDYGLATEGATTGTFTPTLASTITGLLGSLTVKTDILNASIGAGGVGPVKIGGSLIGGSAAGSGSIVSSASIGAITIGGDVAGGAGASSGDITAMGGIGAIKIGGSLIGAGGAGMPSSSSHSGYISSTGNIGAVSIGQNLMAGHFDESGKIQCGGSMTSLFVGGSILGGDGNENTVTVTFATLGQVAIAMNLGPLKIGGNVTGGAGKASGAILINNNVGAVTVGGSVTGGASQSSGSIFSENLMGAVTIAGSIVGGFGADPANDGDAGEIFAKGSMGAARIGGSIIGGATTASGYLGSNVMSSVLVGGSIVGGSYQATGVIFAGAVSGAITVAHDLIGGSGSLALAGAIFSGGNSGAIKIGGSIEGGSATESGLIDIEGALPSLQVGGSIIAGTGAESGGVTSQTSIGTVLIKENMIGTAANHAFIDSLGPQVAPNARTDVAIKSLTVNGNMIFSDILAGQAADEIGEASFQNGSAQLGAIKILGNFEGSNIAAGVGPGAQGYVQGASALPNAVTNILSSIASITIGGQAIGTTPSDSSGTIYGIVAKAIGSVKIGAATIPLKAGPDNDTTAIPLGIAGGLDLYELPVAM